MQKWVDKLWLRRLKHQHCEKCNKVLSESLKLEQMPLFIPFIVQHVTIHIDFEILVQKQSYFLGGIIYYGNNHFTSRIIDHLGNIWYHDGMTSKSSVINEGKIHNMSTEQLKTAKDRTSVILIYCKK